MMHGWNLRKHLPTFQQRWESWMTEGGEGKRGKVFNFQRFRSLHIFYIWLCCLKRVPALRLRAHYIFMKSIVALPQRGKDSRAKYVNHPRGGSSFHQTTKTDSFHQHPPSLRLSTLNCCGQCLAHFARPSTVIDSFFQLNKALLPLLLVNTQWPPIQHNIHSSYTGNIISLHAKLIPPLLLK